MSDFRSSAQSVVGEILRKLRRARRPCRLASASAMATESGDSKALTPESWPSTFSLAAIAVAMPGDNLTKA